MPSIGQLPIPREGEKDTEAFEIVRVWIVDQKPHLSIRTGVWDDPAAWGIVLADLAKHLVEVYRQTDARDASATMQRILDGLHAELD